MRTRFLARSLHAGLLAAGIAGPLLISPGFGTQAAPAAPEPASHSPAPPRVYVDTRYAPGTGKTISVKAGGDLQAALNRAKSGDTVVLQAGAVYSGNFTLPARPESDTGWITIESSDLEHGLPAPGTRVAPADAIHMPKLEASTRAVLTAGPGAHHYRLIGLEIRPGPSELAGASRVFQWLKSGFLGGAGTAAAPARVAFLHNLVVLGIGNEDDVDKLPHHIIIDRCYLHGDPVVGARRGVAMNARYGAVIDSYFSEFKQEGEDAQTINSWNSPGPFKIVNNYLQAAGEGTLFGGQDPEIKGLVPSDIEVRGNYYTKSLAWHKGDPSYQGVPWTVKNIFELKNAQRVLVEGNVFEYNWAQSQDGFSILFTVRDQDGGAPWSVVQDVTFRNNVVRHVANAVNILGQDNNHPSQQTKRIVIANNLFDDIGGDWGPGTLLSLNDGSEDVAFTHNTSLQTGSIIFTDGRPDRNFRYTDNIALQNRYGIIGTDRGPGSSTIQAYFPDGRVERNVIVGGRSVTYPSGNFFPHGLEAVGFSGATGRNYRLASASAYRSEADDGRDIGVDMDALCHALTEFGSHPDDGVPSCAGR